MDNSAALGYMILAAKAVGIPVETIRELESAMTQKMDFLTEEQATKAYREF